MSSANVSAADIIFTRNDRMRTAVVADDENRARVAVLTFTVGMAMLAHSVLYAFLHQWTARTQYRVDSEIVRNSKWPMFLLFPTASCRVQWSKTFFAGDPRTNILVGQSLSVMLILQSGWLIITLLRSGFASLSRKHKWWKKADPAGGSGTSRDPIKVAKALQAEETWHRRKIATQLDALERLSRIVVCFGMFIGVVFTFNDISKVYMAFLASAGAAGIVFGFAAKPGLKNSINSATVAITQPIIIDDVVIINSDYSTIQEINSQYVITRVWDGRRHVVPISQFTDFPFENRTKKSTWKISATLFYFDSLVVARLPELRSHVQHLLTSEPLNKLWDKKVMCVQLTDMKTDGTVEVRVLVSCDLGVLADVRNTLRELVHAYVVEKWPGALARSRCEARTFDDDGTFWNRPDRMDQEQGYGPTSFGI